MLTSSASVLVVNDVRAGLTVDPMTTNFIIYNNRISKNTGIITLREGFTSAFVNSREFGQDTPTGIQIRVSDMPQGLTMHFPATVTANETSARLTTATGAPVDLFSPVGGSTVVFSFTGAVDSDDVVESFDIPFTVTIDGTLGSSQPTIEAGLFPIGSAVPNAAQPATNIPRFAADYQSVSAGTSKTVTKTIYWTGIDASLDNRISIFNPSASNANLTLTAFDAAGNSLGLSPVAALLGGNQTLDKSLSDLFGSGLSTIATVRVQSTAEGILGMATSGASGSSGSFPLADQTALGFMLPSFGDNGRLSLFNPGSATTTGAITLLSAEGATMATSTITLQPTVSVSKSTQDLFGTNASGQIVASFTGPVIASESSGVSALNFIEPQIPVEVSTWYLPFYAIGGGYETDLSVINPSDQTLTLRAQAFDSQGSPQGIPKQIVLAPSGQILTTVSRLFDLTAFSTGYVQIEVAPLMRWIRTYYPGIVGHVRVHTAAGASTVFPIVAYPVQNSYLLNSGSPGGQFQGIAILNPNGSSATVTIEAMDARGTVLATTTTSMKTGEFSSRLLTERFGTSIPEHSTIRISSSVPVVAVSLAGGVDLKSFHAIPAIW